MFDPDCQRIDRYPRNFHIFFTFFFVLNAMPQVRWEKLKISNIRCDFKLYSTFNQIHTLRISTNSNNFGSMAGLASKLFFC